MPNPSEQLPDAASYPPEHVYDYRRYRLRLWVLTIRWIACVLGSYIPLMGVSSVVKPFAGENTNIQASLTFTLTLVLTTTVAAAVAVLQQRKIKQQSEELVRQRGVIEDLEKENQIKENQLTQYRNAYGALPAE